MTPSLRAQVTDGSAEVFLGTRDGMAIRFAETDVRAMGRTAYGVRGITLRDEDYAVAMEVVKPGGTLLTVTEHGYGKKTEIDEYRVQARGGVGIINIATSERNGKVVGVAYVQEGDELLVITQQGMILRMQTNDVRAIGRATQGVRLIDIEGEDKVVSIARLVEKEDDAEAKEAEPEPSHCESPWPLSCLLRRFSRPAASPRSSRFSISSSRPAGCATKRLLARFSTVIFEPLEQGIIVDFEVTKVTLEQRR